MNAPGKTIDWQRVHQRLQETQLALHRAATANPRRIADAYQQRALQLAQRRKQKPASSTLPVLGFWVGESRCGLELRVLAEVRPLGPCAPVPGAPPQVLGVVNLRGQFLPVIDLAGLLGLPPGATGTGGYALFLNKGRCPCGLKVDGVDQIRLLAPGEWVDPAAAETFLPTRYVRGLIPNALVLLDAEAILSHPVFAEIS
jgi:purine-binding chemotaxis protein CheW